VQQPYQADAPCKKNGWLHNNSKYVSIAGVLASQTVFF
jgi:hypothetical protein